MATLYDIAIVGATPAGYAAAYALQKKRHNVILVDIPSASVESPLAEWAPPELFRLNGLPTGLTTRCKAKPFRAVRYHNVRLDRQITHQARKTLGYFFEMDDLCKAMKQSAVKAGVTMRTFRKAPIVEIGEDSITLVGTTRLTAKLVLLANNHPADAMGTVGLAARLLPRSGLTLAGLDIPLPSRGKPKEFAGALHLIETPERTELGMAFTFATTLHLRIISASLTADAPGIALSGMVANMQQADLLPPRLALTKARGAIWRPPAGLALEMETHLTKRCLLAGTAGGFADSVTGQTLMPSVQSALIAADVADNTLKSKHPQEALAKFEILWRKKLAEALRPPNIAVHMILPLLLANKKLVANFTQTVLYGQDF